MLKKVSSEFVSLSEKTFCKQSSLQSLPVPDLESSVKKYLDSVKPLVSNADYGKTKEIATSFCQNEGKVLHQFLVDKAKTTKNWLSQWWLDYAYLRTREPNAPNVNIGGPMPSVYTVWPPQRDSSTERIGIFMRCIMEYWQLIRREQLSIERGGRGEAFCMEQYKRVFNWCRIPHKQCDLLEYYFKTESEGSCPTHAVVAHNGRLFRIELVHDDGRETLFNPTEISRQIEKIVDLCRDVPRGGGKEGGSAASAAAAQYISCLTAHRRDSWHQLREHLIGLDGGQNHNRLKVIEEAVCVISLDPAQPTNFTEMMQAGLTGDGNNRYYDKVNYSAFENGTFHTYFDHTPAEATTVGAPILYTHLRLQDGVIS